MPTGTPATISPEDAKYVSDKGTEFTIETANNGLFFIKMRKGGLAPPMTEEFFTSKVLAELTLMKYLRIRDRLGNAKFPSKDK